MIQHKLEDYNYVILKRRKIYIIMKRQNALDAIAEWKRLMRDRKAQRSYKLRMLMGYVEKQTNKKEIVRF